MVRRRRPVQRGLAWLVLVGVGGAGCAQESSDVRLVASPLIDTRALCQDLQAKLPKGWKIESVTEADAPQGWARLAGDPGLRVHMENRGLTMVHPILGSYHPTFTIWLMPLAWEGSEPSRNQHVRGGEFTQGTYKPDPDPQSFPAVYWGTTSPFHYFYTNVGMGPWRKAPVITAKVLAVAHWEPPPAPADTQPGEAKSPAADSSAATRPDTAEKPRTP